MRMIQRNKVGSSIFSVNVGEGRLCTNRAVDVAYAAGTLDESLSNVDAVDGRDWRHCLLNLPFFGCRVVDLYYQAR